MAEREDNSGYVASDEPLTDRACVRCAHYRKHMPGYDDMNHLCARPQFGVTLDRVLGENVPNVMDAYVERRNPDACGPEGKFWSQSGF